MAELTVSDGKGGSGSEMRAITKLFVSMTVTGGVAVAGLAAIDVPALVSTHTRRAEAVSAQNGCRAVDFAILAYATRTGRQPTTITELPDLDPDGYSAYRIQDGRATGPGCQAL